ncbi:MAG: hypothetical protein KBA40_03000 [Candidatus Peribacteraceae bacterium]|nr:hypothetical protein [Candidatus Peribacteraceae bacterium]
MTTTEIIGYIAAVIGTVLMLPQVIKSIQTKSAKDVSALMLSAYLIQCVLWSIYGLRIHAAPVYLCNMIAFCIGLVQVGLKLKYAKTSIPLS